MSQISYRPEGGFLIPQVIEEDISGPVRRVLVRLRLVKPKLREVNLVAEMMALMDKQGVVRNGTSR